MSLSHEEESALSAAISDGLDRAEKAWEKVGNQFVTKYTFAMDSVRFQEQKAPSKIPGHLLVTDGIPKVDDFIAMVVDMRDSTQRLKTRLAPPKISGFQRVFYETSALLPAISVLSSFEDGSVTEYLGDGALALFQVDRNDIVNSVRNAGRVARNCISTMRTLLNQELESRYNLPRVDLGVGLAISKAMVTLVGSDDNLQPKAIGECVWEATKLSGGRNKVFVSQNIYENWPTSKGGLLRFAKDTVRGVEGYRIYKEK